ncbi:MAG TPA: TetR family transcriptional regulator C-terminal domain-containing protein [Longimicrobiaceae bacterium]|nr:TetR family transcriptional regulator C-terminal domain-containing protein [Longimicrobiaceae bacterium]
MHATKERLLEEGMVMLLERGYNDLGVQAILDRTGVPKGSFYHHFPSKEAMALQAVDLYLSLGHELLEATLAPDGRPPLERVRGFFEQMREMYSSQGYLGCLLGALGQEMSGSSEVFRRRIEECVASIAGRVAVCIEEARQAGDLPATVDPEGYADALVNAWEGAALRSRLLRSPVPLNAFLSFYFPVAAEQ